MSNSVSFREKGNIIYKSVLDHFSPTIRKYRLEEATKCYNQAIQCATNDDEKASGLKNLGAASLKMANLCLEMREKREMIEYFFTEAVKNTSHAYYVGCRFKDVNWLQQILSSCMESMTLAMDFEYSFELETRSRNVLGWIRYLPDDLDKRHWNLELSKIHFHIAIDAVEKQDYKKALYQLHECYQPIEEAQKFITDDPSIQTEINVMKTDVWMHMCVAESQQARNTGDNYLKIALKDAEDLNMDLIWDVADWYRKAILKAKELDVENEAIAYSRLGRLYDKVLKMKLKAKEKYTRCLELSQSLYPKLFTTYDWYQECVQTLERYQQETINKDEKEQEKEKQEALKGFTAELDKLQKASKGHGHSISGLISFLKFIYTTFPPKNSTFKLQDGMDNLDRPEIKKIYLKAILHYHPDRQDEKHGKGWKFFASEITKTLNARYDNLKVL